MTHDAVLAALGESSRRALLARLAQGPCAAGELAAAAGLSAAAASQHLKRLREAGLVAVQPQGRLRVYRLEPGVLQPVAVHLAAWGCGPAVPARQPDPLEERAIEHALSALPDLDGDVMRISGRIRQLVKRSEVSLKHLAQRCGLHPGEFFLLEALWRLGSPYESTPTQLCRMAWVTLAGVGKRIDRLERAGYVVRRPDPEDARGSRVRLLPKGRQVVERAAPERFAVPEYWAAMRLSAPERALLARLLGVMLGHVDELEAQQAGKPPAAEPKR